MLGDRLSPSEYARLMQALEKQNSLIKSDMLASAIQDMKVKLETLK